MTPRVRRLLRLGTIVILLLFVGRWTVDALATRWWAATISPAAAGFLDKWMLLGLALDLTAIAVASTWFTAQAVLVARLIATVQVERQVGALRIREPVPLRALFLGGGILGILLGVLTGAGARAWRAPLALATQGVSYGLPDPLLDRDVGVLVAQLPLWTALHGFALSLALLGLALAAVLYLAIGAITRGGGAAPHIHPEARRHLGALLAVLAMVLAAGSLLTPYQLAASADPPLGLLASRTRIVAAQALAGAAIGVAIMSLAWAIRARHSLVLAGWLILGLGAGIERFLVPAFAAEGSGSPTRDEDVRRMAAAFWGLTVTEGSDTDTLPRVTAIWDAPTLARSLGSSGVEPTAILPTMLDTGEGAPLPGWIASGAPRTTPGRLDLVGIAEGTLARTGAPEVLARTNLPEPRTQPDAPAWMPVAADRAGVRAGAWPRRLALAWARQAPTMLRVDPANRVDWHLDPRERSAALLPMLDWRLEGAVLVDGTPTWVTTGYAVQGTVPLLVPRRWGGRDAAGVTPVVVGTVDAATGATAFYQDPAGGPLASAWAQFADGLIRPAGEMSDALRERLPYPGAWLDAQLSLLDQAEWTLGRRPGQRVADGPPGPPLPGWDSTGVFWATMYEDPSRRMPSALVTARRRAGQPELVVRRYEGSAAENARELERRWSRGVVLSHLRDSVRAAGDSLLAGPVRWHLGPMGPLAWSAWVTEGRRGDRPQVVWIATARGGRLGGARTLTEAWAALGSEAAPGAPSGAGDRADATARLTSIRGWLARGDSALARGDLIAFGRAWEAIRGLLRELEAP